MRWLKRSFIPVIATKADSKVMAVACASVIAYYLTNLYVDALDQMLESEYGISIPLARSAGYNAEAFWARSSHYDGRHGMGITLSQEQYREFHFISCLILCHSIKSFSRN